MDRKPKPKKITQRQAAFIEAMVDPTVKSKAEAARIAGYSPKSAREAAHKNTANYYISNQILTRRKRAINHAQVTPEEVLGSAAFNMRSSMDDLMDKEGYFDLEKARETGAVDLIKEMEIIETIDPETGARTVRHKVKLESPAAARKEVANYIGLGFHNQPQTPIAQVYAIRLITEHKWTIEDALEAARIEFNADVEALGKIIEAELVD